ncbi:hypothetical protein [Marinobacterium litorale]|jgi:hypothetical protein|uniref:hypothetical protein n=1 Tax=Marinobacterium litorale TaxID=404770 RepID=UPI0004061C57|nr:hypothetical protein [Marinobacterium litorale]
MTQKLPALLSAEQCSALLSAAQAHTEHFRKSVGVWRRMGVNGPNVLSQYRFLKYWQFPDALKEAFAAQVPASLRDTSNEAWLLHFPTGGLLDRYAAPKTLFNCLSIPLNSGGIFKIWEGADAVTHTNQAGDGYLFPLAAEHEVPVTAQDDWYLCFLFLHHIEVMPNA